MNKMLLFLDFFIVNFDYKSGLGLCTDIVYNAHSDLKRKFYHFDFIVAVLSCYTMFLVDYSQT